MLCVHIFTDHTQRWNGDEQPERTAKRWHYPLIQSYYFYLDVQCSPWRRNTCHWFTVTTSSDIFFCLCCRETLAVLWCVTVSCRELCPGVTTAPWRVTPASTPACAATTAGSATPCATTEGTRSPARQCVHPQFIWNTLCITCWFTTISGIAYLGIIFWRIE